MSDWLQTLNGDPLPWLLDEQTPAVRHLALRHLLDQPSDARDVREAQAAAMREDPIATIFAAQSPEGYWVRPGGGYNPKYQSTVWSLIFLDQMGADGSDPRIQRACEYVLAHTQALSGGFGAWGGGKREAPPPPSTVIHCLNGNLLRALIGFGWLEDERTQRAIDWQAAAITGEGAIRFYRSGTSGPGFCCSMNERLPCAWGAVKALLALARIPTTRRSPHVARAIEQGTAFLLSCDPVTAAYPTGWGNTKPSALWFRPGFPLGYTADVLQLLAVLCELGYAKDPRLENAGAWLRRRQGPTGRWRNQSPPRGKTWVEADKRGAESKWVTLGACAVLKAMYA
ncbi:MAG TPA: hypothetical protein VF808_13250 [Ktedonobacterales bacterium]